MNNNEAFLIYKSFYEPIKFLSDEQMGKLFKAIFEYQVDGTEGELEPQINMAFQFFKNQFRVDNNKYEETRILKSEGGKKGGGNPNFRKGQTNPYYQKDNCKDNSNIIQPAKIDNSDNLDKDSLCNDKDTLTDIKNINTHKLNVNENVNENDNENVNENVACEQKIFFENFEIDNLPTTNSWKTLLKKWVDYREELGCPLVSNAIGPTYQELLHLSGNNIETAKRIVNKSICSGYKGLFTLKNEDLQAVDVEEKPIEKELNWKEKDYQNLWIKAKTGIGMYTEKDEQIAKNHYSGISSLLEKLRNMNDEQIKMFKPEFISRLAE